MSVSRAAGAERQANEERTSSMKHLNLSLEKLEERIAPWAMTGGGGSKGSEEEGSNESENHSEKNHSDKHHSK